MQPIHIEYNTAQEWTVTSAAAFSDNNTDGDPVLYPNNHTFHMHVNPFQIVRRVDIYGKIHPMNLWRDTLLIRGGESYTIRTRFRDFQGTAALHCHILDHEDQGMMVPINIADTNRALAPNSKQSLKDGKMAFPVVSLPDLRGRKTDLADLRDQNLVVVFFRGAGCPHCTEQLRELLAVARKSPDFDAEIVAISSERIASEEQATKLLESEPNDRLRLLVDAERTAFRDFGCLRNGDPKHGLFIVAKDGTILSSYVGESPFADVQEVRRRVRSLKEIDTAAVR
jgi:peroxiredoxin